MQVGGASLARPNIHPSVRPEDEPLHDDVRWLAAALGRVIRRLEGEHAYETVESIRQAASSVTFMGPVRSPQIPWTEDLTLAKALVIANYYPRENPKEIIVVRAGQAHRVDPAQLLAGNDFPLLAGDIVQIR